MGVNQSPVSLSDVRIEHRDNLLQSSLLHILWNIVLPDVIGMGFLEREREGGREGGKEGGREGGREGEREKSWEVKS